LAWTTEVDVGAGTAASSERLSSELLGFPAGARVLIVNCDDLGMHESVNAAVVEAIEEGIAGSASLMVPCPAAEQAMQLLGRRPSMPFGIHLTLTRDGPAQRWAPVTPAAEVPSLLDADGLLFTSAAAPRLLAQARIEDVERELLAQIDAVARSGLRPTHLDWHVLADGGRSDVLDLTLTLARDHGLAARVWLDPGREEARARGLPVVDHDFLDSFALPVAGRAECYVQALRSLPAGLSEWAVHPAVGAETAAETDLGWAVRRADHAFLCSRRASRVIDEEGIVVIDHRALQRVWAAVEPGTGALDADA
jgi:chitin disaccharide deacetylase